MCDPRARIKRKPSLQTVFMQEVRVVSILVERPGQLFHSHSINNSLVNYSCRKRKEEVAHSLDAFANQKARSHPISHLG